LESDKHGDGRSNDKGWEEMVRTGLIDLSLRSNCG
jgi:hypothetical protein